MAATVLVAAMVFLAHDAPRAAAVTGPNFSMSLAGGACHPSGGNADCDVDPNSNFTLTVTLGKINLPSYRGFQVKLTTPSALPYTNRPGTEEVIWLDCQTPYDNASQPPMYLAGCNRFTAPNPSTYLGPVLEVDYHCGASSTQVYTITMLQGAAEDATYLVDNSAHSIDPEGGPSKTMTIRCQPSTPVAVGGVAQLPAIAEQAIDARDAGSSSPTRAMGLAVVAATLVTSATLWFARRRA